MTVKIGDVVAFNKLKTATWFDVIDIKGFMLTIREHGNTDHAEQHIDCSLVKRIKK